MRLASIATHKFPPINSKLSLLLDCLFLGLVIYATAFFSIHLSRTMTDISALWLPNAFAVALIASRDKHQWPALLAATFIGNALAGNVSGTPCIMDIIASTANIVEITICALFLTQFSKPRFETADVSLFLRLLIGAVLGTALASFIGTFGVWITNGQSLLNLYLTWFKADTLGLLIFTPCFSLIINGLKIKHLRGDLSPRNASLFWLGFIVVTALIFGQRAYDLQAYSPILLIYMALAFSYTGLAVSTATLSLVALIAVNNSYPLGHHFLATYVNKMDDLQFYIFMLYMTSMPVALALSHRKKLENNLTQSLKLAVNAKNDLIKSELSFLKIAEAARDVIVRFEPDGRFTYISPSVKDVLGYEPNELLRMSIQDITHPQDWALRHERVKELIAQGPNGKTMIVNRRLMHKDGRFIVCEGRPRIDFNLKTGKPRQFYDIWRDVSQQQATQAALQSAADDAMAANRAKDAFLANMSHEIRTPLTGIIGMIELLLGSKLDTKQQERAQIARGSALDLLEIVNNVLDYSKLAEGHIPIELTDFSPKTIVKDVVALFYEMALDKNTSLNYTIAADLPKLINSDPIRLRQILLNLVGNAVKFTHQGHIKLTVSCDAPNKPSDDILARLRFEVRDSGIGIKPEDQGAIFERFSQGDVTTTRKFGGTGLGLAISQQLAKLLGGKIEVESSPGAGSRFWFTIDALKPTGLSDNQALRKKSKIIPQNKPTQRRGLKVLVAEDHPVNQKLIAAFLSSANIDYVMAENGEIALECLKNQSFDLILMDIQMPIMDGISASKAIRNLPSPIANIPIIALTSSTLSGDKERYLSAGMNDFVAKPIDAVKLISTILSHAPAPTKGVAKNNKVRALRA